jgi:hypothetical protein
MMKIFARFCLLFVLLSACGPDQIVTEGDSLESLKAEQGAAVGKTRAFTLEQINIERDAKGPYVRTFDTSHNTSFLYIPENMVKTVGRLVRGNKYIYRFKVTENDKFGANGELSAVAHTNGIPIGSADPDTDIGAKAIVLAGPAAHGKSFTVSVTFGRTNETEPGKAPTIGCSDTSPYGTEITLSYPDNLAAEVTNLASGDKRNLRIKVEKTDWRVFGELEAILSAQ